MLHLNKPNDQFYNRSNNQLGYRFTGSLSGDFDISRSTILKTDVYYTYQKKAWETVFGAMVGIKSGEAYRKENNSIFWIGSYFRMIDAWSPIVGYSYKQCRLLINYDVIISKLSRTGKLNGGSRNFISAGGWLETQAKRTKMGLPEILKKNPTANAMGLILSKYLLLTSSNRYRT
jgi:hypothetical protein